MNCSLMGLSDQPTSGDRRSARKEAHRGRRPDAETAQSRRKRDCDGRCEDLVAAAGVACGRWGTMRARCLLCGANITEHAVLFDPYPSRPVVAIDPLAYFRRCGKRVALRLVM